MTKITIIVFSITELYKSNFSAKILQARCEEGKLKWSFDNITNLYFKQGYLD